MRRLPPSFAPAIVAALLLAGCGTAAPQQSSSPSTLYDEPVATLRFEPEAVTLKAGETAEVKVTLDLKGRASQTYQAEIAYDPALVEVVDADPKTRGVQVSTGMYETGVENTVDAAAGRIRLLGYSITEGKDATGQGTLATITLRGKKAGSSKLSFERVPGDSTSKTKVILKGTSKDLLADAGTATVTVH
jgi:hypothetical protein